MTNLLLTSLICALVALVGCDQVPLPAQPQVVIDQVESNQVPEHELRTYFLGRWGDRNESEPSYVFSLTSDGLVELRGYEAPAFTSIVNSIRWEGQALVFSHYHYFNEPHPFNGVEIVLRMEIDEERQSIEVRATTDQLDEVFTDTLVRK